MNLAYLGKHLKIMIIKMYCGVHCIRIGVTLVYFYYVLKFTYPKIYDYNKLLKSASNFGISNEFIANLVKKLVIFIFAKKLYFMPNSYAEFYIMSHSNSVKTVNWYETMNGMKYYAFGM